MDLQNKALLHGYFLDAAVRKERKWKLEILVKW